MKILVIGSGGREHALAWKFAQSPLVEKVYVAPGNAGTALEARLQNVAINAIAFEDLADFAQKQRVALTVVGPEVPLVKGLVDYFQARDLPCFGPSKAAAQLEGSKSFAKNFLKRHQIPSADSQTFSELTSALTYLRQKGAPTVVKADGLAAGKGVIVAENLSQAEHAVEDMLSGNAFGDAGCKVVIEDFLEGEEASFIVMVDGKNILPMASSQDHKRIGNGDTGLNTGGMGAYSPAPVITPTLHKRIMKEIIEPTVAGMAAEGNHYTGFLYAGLMITGGSIPKVIEYNCRFGDPETQPIMLRLQSDLADLCLHAMKGTLDQCSAKWDQRTAVGVVLAAGGYPQSYHQGDLITGLPERPADDQKLFHAGTAIKHDQIVTNGGRVLCATALGDTVTEAQRAAYALARQIQWDNMYYRNDIAYRAIEREQNQGKS